VKYRLSTLFLIVLSCAISLGWYADRMSRSRRDIVGTWHYPTEDINLTGYYSQLEIRSDGTFTKIQGHHHGNETFSGTYAVEKSGQVIFHVTKKVILLDLAKALGQEPETRQCDAHYACRCAVDPTGYLVIDDRRLSPFNDEDTGIRWETCSRK